VALKPMRATEAMTAEYHTTGLSARFMPLGFLRERLKASGVLSAAELPRQTPGRRVQVAGLVIVRQHPGTAKGFVFLTLEDETGFINLIVKPPVYTRFRPVINRAALVLAAGIVQRERTIVNLLVESIRELKPKDSKLAFESRDFR